MTDKQPEALIRADELEAIGAESSLARAMAAHTIRLLYKENEALRARLAGWEKLNMNDHKEGDLGIGTVKWDASAPLVMHPHPAFQATQPQREWQGLTENEIKHLWYEACQTNLELTSQLIVHLARNIEAKLKEKNT